MKKEADSKKRLEWRLRCHSIRLKKLKKKAASSDNDKITYEAAKVSALVSELEPKKNTIKKTTNNTDPATDKDILSSGPTTSVDVANDAHEPTNATLSMLCTYIINALKKKAFDHRIQDHIRNTFEDMTTETIAIIIKLYNFLRPFVLPDVDQEDVDNHILPSIFVINMCNTILETTGYGRYARALLPQSPPSKVHALHCNVDGIYNLVRATMDDFSRKDSVMKTSDGIPIVSSTLAKDNKPAVMNMLIDMEKVTKLCDDRKAIFDSKFIVTSSGLVRLQALFSRSKTSTDKVVSDTQRKGTYDAAKMIKLKSSTTELKKSVTATKQPIKGKKEAIKTLKHEITIILEAINATTDPTLLDTLSKTKVRLVQERKYQTHQLDNVYQEVISQYREIDSLNKQKSLLYHASNDDNPSPRDSSVPSPSTSPYLKEDTRYIGVDPGIRTLASSANLDHIQAGACILIPTKFQPLEDFLTNNPDHISRLKKINRKDITAKSINSRSRTHQHLIQIKKKKKEHEIISNVERQFTAVEDKDIPATKAVILQHEKAKNVRPILQSFYTNSTWAKKQTNGRQRFTDKAYCHAAKSMVKSSPGNPTNVVFFGDAGRSLNSRIKGHVRRSPDLLQSKLKAIAEVHSTNEYLSTKLCFLCDQRVEHPKRHNGSTNLDVITCINPSCLSRKHGFCSRGRDLNAAVNMIKIGLYKQAPGKAYPAFSRTSSASVSATTATTATTATALFGHSTSWFERMGIPPSLKGRGDGHPLRM